MIYILTAVFVLYVINNELRLKASFYNFWDYISKGIQGRAYINTQMASLRDQVRKMDEDMLKHSLRIEALEEPNPRRRSTGSSPLKVKLPKNFGIVKMEKAAAQRIKNRDKMRAYRAKKRANNTK